MLQHAARHKALHVHLTCTRQNKLRVLYQLRDCGQTSIDTVSSTEMMQLLANMKPEWLRYEEQLDAGLVKMASVAKVGSWRGCQSFFYFLFLVEK